MYGSLLAEMDQAAWPRTEALGSTSCPPTEPPLTSPDLQRPMRELGMPVGNAIAAGSSKSHFAFKAKVTPPRNHALLLAAAALVG